MAVRERFENLGGCGPFAFPELELALSSGLQVAGLEGEDSGDRRSTGFGIPD